MSDVHNSPSMSTEVHTSPKMSTEVHTSCLLSPIDSRYRAQTTVLSQYLSDFALVKYRVHVEIEYLIALAETLGVPFDAQALRLIHDNFNTDDFCAVYQHELTCKHDVKAVEYFLRDNIPDTDLYGMIHFALTSQDINNTAIPMMLRDAVKFVYIPCLQQLIGTLDSLANKFSGNAILSRTHGQPATPTSMGKELRVFHYRLSKQIHRLDDPEVYQAKFSGTVGNFNAHIVAHPDVDWPAFADKFIQGPNIRLVRQQYTTQISNYDDFAEIFQVMSRVNVILIDLVRDIWQYISIGYFKLPSLPGEVGSSVMPHKVNPIDFENAEGNLGMANAMFNFFAQKLPVSRLQRDLSDSTVLRSISIPMAQTHIAFNSIIRGLGKLSLDTDATHEDLRKNWCVVTEAIQTILRRENVADPYALLKAFSRGRELTEADTLAFIQTLDLPDHVKTELSSVTPFNYTGNS